jgi:hypothetical protein
MATPSVELQVLRKSQDRALHMEGIPMFVALVDERSASDMPAPSNSEAERGGAIAARLEEFRTALGPRQRDTDMGAVISMLMAAAYEDFNCSVLG